MIMNEGEKLNSLRVMGKKGKNKQFRGDDGKERGRIKQFQSDGKKEEELNNFRVMGKNLSLKGSV